MQKSAPTLGRVLTMVAFALSCFGLLLFLWLAFGGPIPLQPQGYRFHIQFPEATQLAKEADVRISGVPVGKVKELKPDAKTGLTDATIGLDSKYAPIPRDARAILRQKTLLGETYVELSPGTHPMGDKQNGLKEGATLNVAQVAPTVQLDEIFRAFNGKTRAAFRAWLQRQASALGGRGEDINNALGNLPAFAEDSNRLVSVLNTHEAATRQLVRNTGEVFSALAKRDGQLRGLVRNSNALFDATARQNASLREIFQIFPTFEDESRITFNRLARFAQNTNPLVTQLRPAARELSPTLVSLGRLAPDLKGFFSDLGPLTRVSLKGLPAGSAFLKNSRPALAELDPVLRELNPVLSFIGLYKRELSAFFSNSTAATEAQSSPNGSNSVHYLRLANPVSPETLATYPVRPSSNRANAYALPGAFDRLNRNLLGFETRQCSGTGTKVLPPTPGRNGIPSLTELNAEGDTGTAVKNLLNQIRAYYFGNTSQDVNDQTPAPAPKCLQQPASGPRTKAGTSDYPHVTVVPPTR